MKYISKSNTSDFTNYVIVVFALMAVNPFFGTIINVYKLILLLFLLLVATKRRIKVIDKKIALILLVIYLLIGIQGFLFRGFSAAAIYFPLITFYVPFLIYKILGVSFFRYFIKVIYVIAIYTLPLWFLQCVLPDFDSFLRQAIHTVFDISWASTPRSLLIYTAAWSNIVFNESLGIYRNSGLFHEPGAYGVFLSLAVIINTLLTGKMFSKKNMFLIFALLTTLSTAAFIVLFVFVSAILYKLRVNIFIRTVGLLLFFIVSYQTYINQEFMKEKIETQFEYQTYAAEFNLGIYSGQSGRFFAFFKSLKHFLANPLFGRGILSATSYKATGEMHKFSSYSYGFMGILATYGLFMGLYYLYYFYKGLLRFSNSTRQSIIIVLAGYIAINLALSTQGFIMSTTLVLIFITGVYSHSHSTKEEKKELHHQIA
jgi:hypothetical protein